MSLPPGFPPGRPMMPVAGNGSPARRVQYAALPYRVRRDGEVQIRLITSRETRRWVIPKGWPIKGLTPPKTAARESYEEAGLMGTVSREPIGLYTYEKRLGTRTVLCDVLVFPLKVKRHLQKWPERFQRYGFWFSVESAAAAVQEEDLGALITDFGALMARKQEAKQKAEAEKAAAAKAEKAAKLGKGKTPPAPAEDVAAQAAAAVEPASAPQDKRKDAAKKKAVREAKAGAAEATASEPSVEAASSPGKAKRKAERTPKGKASKSEEMEAPAPKAAEPTLSAPPKGKTPKAKSAKPKSSKVKVSKAPGPAGPDAEA